MADIQLQPKTGGGTAWIWWVIGIIALLVILWIVLT